MSGNFYFSSVSGYDNVCWWSWNKRKIKINCDKKLTTTYTSINKINHHLQDAKRKKITREYMNMYLAKGYRITIGHCCFSTSWRHKLIYINNYTLIPCHLHPIKRGNFKQLLKRPSLIWVSINVRGTDPTPPPHLILPLMRCHSFGTLQQHCNM